MSIENHVSNDNNAGTDRSIEPAGSYSLSTQVLLRRLDFSDWLDDRISHGGLNKRLRRRRSLASGVR
jgi:hypothetical protein